MFVLLFGTGVAELDRINFLGGFVKTLFVSILIACSSASAWAENPLTLKEHMRAMGYILDEVFSRADQSATYKEAAAKTRELRQHLIQSIALQPTKISSMREAQRNAAMIDYHQLMARVIYLSATLEHTFSAGDDFQATSNSRENDIRNLLHEINVIVGQAHRKYRD